MSSWPMAKTFSVGSLPSFPTNCLWRSASKGIEPEKEREKQFKEKNPLDLVDKKDGLQGSAGVWIRNCASRGGHEQSAATTAE